MKTNSRSTLGSLEPLEARIAPATLFALNEANQLVRFDSATPGTLEATLAFTGLGAGETLRGIDFRPETSELFAVSVATGSAANSIVHTYVVNTTTGTLTVVGQTAAGLAGAADVPTGFDFNPTVDRLRYGNTSNENARLNPNNGSLAGNDTDLTYTAPATGPIIASAYDRNFANTPLTTLFAIDRGASRLVVQGGVDGTGPGGPNGGAITAIGVLGVTLSATADGGFDIENTSGTAFAALTASDNLTRLYTIDLTSGAATVVGNIGTGATGIRSLSAAPAALQFVDPKTATYLDQEGDLVTVKVSQGTLDAGNFKMAFKANGGLELHLLDMSAAEFNLADVSILAKKTKAGGDGAAAVGRIVATAVDLGKVTVGGDLAQIDAGDGDPGKPALAALSVQSLGVANVSARLFGDLVSTLDGSLGSLTVKKDVQGATINVTGDIGKVTVGGSLIGSGGTDSGAVIASGNIGPAKIGGSLLGTAFTRSGAVDAGGTLASISVGGSLRGDVGIRSGAITAGSMGKVTIRGDAVGGGGDYSGSVLASGDGGLGDVTITGSLFATTNTLTGIVSGGPLGAVKIGGELRGLGAVPVRISAEGNLNPADLKAALALKSVTVARGVTNALLLGGYNPAGVATNPDAQIGSVSVGGDWTTSSLVTGATSGTDAFFGNANDATLSDGAGDGVVARIAKIVIKGSVAGGFVSGDHFGFVAHEIGALTIGGRKVPLTAGAGNDDLAASNPLFILAASGDVRVHEVAV